MQTRHGTSKVDSYFLFIAKPTSEHTHRNSLHFVTANSVSQVPLMPSGTLRLRLPDNQASKTNTDMTI